jgi:hypothetical protein
VPVPAPHTGLREPLPRRSGRVAPPSIDARAIRRGRWKLSLNATGESELYDLRADDPEEMHNAIRDAGTAGVVADLYQRLRRWQHETGDALALPDPR